MRTERERERQRALGWKDNRRGGGEEGRGWSGNYRERAGSLQDRDGVGLK